MDGALKGAPEGAIVLTQLEIPLPTVAHIVRQAAEKRLRVIVDPAPAPPDGVPPEIIEGVCLITPNETEAKALTGIRVVDESSSREAAEALLAAGAQNVVITMGRKLLCLAQMKF